MPRTSNRTLPSRVTAALRYSGVVSTSDVVGAALPAVAALVAAADVAASQAHNNRTTSIVRPVPSPSPRHLGRCHARMMRGGRVLIGSLLTPVASYVIVPGLAPCAVLASVLGGVPFPQARYRPTGPRPTRSAQPDMLPGAQSNPGTDCSPSALRHGAAKPRLPWSRQSRLMLRHTVITPVSHRSLRVWRRRGHCSVCCSVETGEKCSLPGRFSCRWCMCVAWLPMRSL
jgi:hypothetical protein